MKVFRPTKFTQWETTENALPRVFYGGGKSQTSTSQVSIPPEVLAQYSNVNSIANQVAQTPFSQYSTDPSAFVAPLTSSQQAGILGTNQYSNEAQPFYQTASNQNQAATNYGLGAIGSAAGINSAATAYGQGDINSATGLNAAATQGGQGYLTQAASTNRAATQTGQAGLTTAENQTNQAGAPITAAQIQNYENPYESDVINPTDALMQQQFNQAQSGQLGNAINQGAFGGDRSQLTAAALQGQQALAEGNVNAGLLNQNYTQALGEANTEQQAGLQAANQYGAEANQYGALGQASANDIANYGTSYGQLGQAGANNLASYGNSYAGLGQASANSIANYGSAYGSLGQAGATNEANIGAGAQSSGLAGAQAQLTAGQAQQQTEQAGLTALYNQFLQQQSYPFQTTQFLSNIAEGTGALSGSTTTSNQPSPYFSDERLKEDIQPIGKTFDGLNIIKFKYKGDKQTHVGLSAQDVEKKHPEAVGLAGGYKTVDYDAATKPAAERKRFAYGGLAPNYAAEAGFNLDPSYLQAQEAAYGNSPWGNAGPVTGSAPYGGKSHVPPSSGGGHASLSVARTPSAPPSGIQQLAQGLGQIEGLGKTGQSLWADAKGAIPGLGGAATPPQQAQPQGIGTGLAGPAPASRGQPIEANPDPNAGRANASQLASNDNVWSPDGSLEDSLFARRGGRMYRDAGGTTYSDADSDDQSAGGDVPYESGTGSNGLDIPDDKPNNHLATAQTQGSNGGNSGLGGILGDAASIGKDVLGFLPFLNRGGRVGLAGGGSPDDIPLPAMDDAASISQGLAAPDQAAILATHADSPMPNGIKSSKSRQMASAAGLNPDVPSPDAQPVQNQQQQVQDMGSGQHLTQPGEVLTQDNPGGIGDFLNRNQGLIVPGLHGLASMASSNSRYLGSAILQGLGGAADSYENVQNEMQGRSGNQPIIQQRQNDALQSDLSAWQSYTAQTGAQMSFADFEKMKSAGGIQSNRVPQSSPGGANSPYKYTIQEKNSLVLPSGVPANQDPAYLAQFAAKNAGIHSEMVAGQVHQANDQAGQINGQNFTYNSQGQQVTPNNYSNRVMAQNEPAVQTKAGADFRDAKTNFLNSYQPTQSLLGEMSTIYQGLQAGPTADVRARISKLANDLDPNGSIPLIHSLSPTSTGEDYDTAMKDIAQITAQRLGGMSQNAPKSETELLSSFAANPDKSPGTVRDVIIRGQALLNQQHDYYKGYDPFRSNQAVPDYTDSFYESHPFENYRGALEKTMPAFKGEQPNQRNNATATQAPSAPVTLNTQNPDAHYNSLPSGARFVGPDGKIRVKP